MAHVFRSDHPTDADSSNRSSPGETHPTSRAASAAPRALRGGRRAEPGVNLRGAPVVVKDDNEPRDPRSEAPVRRSSRRAPSSGRRG